MSEGETAKAVVSYLPVYSGDGYGYGGGAVLTIGTVSVGLGESSQAAKVAKDMAHRWNCYQDLLEAGKALAQHVSGVAHHLREDAYTDTVDRLVDLEAAISKAEGR